jgi:hypothetical protein
MKRLALLAIAALSIGARGSIPIARPAPPLDVVVPGTLLSYADKIEGARLVRTLTSRSAIGCSTRASTSISISFERGRRVPTTRGTPSSGRSSRSMRSRRGR